MSIGGILLLVGILGVVIFTIVDAIAWMNANGIFWAIIDFCFLVVALVGIGLLVNHI